MKNLAKTLTKLTLTLITLSLIFTLTACSTTTNSEEAELKQQVSELQSQVNSLEEQVNPKPDEPKPIPEEDIPDVDLMELAKKIVSECPPPEGIELVYDTENVEDMFNKGEDKENYVDLNNIDKVIRVYCPTPNESIYYFVIAKPKAGITVHENSLIRYSADDTMALFLTKNLDANPNYLPSCFGGTISNYCYRISLYKENTVKEYEKSQLLDLKYAKKAEQVIIDFFNNL